MQSFSQTDGRSFRMERIAADLVVVGGGLAGVCAAITAAFIASSPLLPFAPPARARACSIDWQVSTPNATGLPVCAVICASPAATAWQMYWSWVVSPVSTQPMQTTASRSARLARACAIGTSSNEPGASTTTRSESAPPAARYASSAPSASLPVTPSW